MQKEIIVKTLLNSRTTELVISSEFAKKQEFKLKEIKRYIYIWNSFNKKTYWVYGEGEYLLLEA